MTESPPPQIALPAVVEFSAEAIMSTDWEGRVTSWNRAAEEVFGYSAAEMLGRPVECLIPPGLEEDQRVLVERTLREERVRDWATLRRHADGTAFPATVSLSVLRGSDGKATGWIGVVRDVTERHRAEQLRARLAAVVEASLDAILTVDLEGRIRAWNAGAEALFGYSAKEMLGQSAARLAPPGRQDEQRRRHWAVAAGEPIKDWETVRLRADGTEIPVSITLSRLSDAAGAVIGLSGLVRDLTEHKELAELAAREQRLRWLSDVLAHIHVGIVLFSGPEHQCVFLNDVAVAYLGGRNPVGLPVREGIVEADAQGFAALLDQVYATGESVHLREARVEVDVGHRTPEERYVDFTYQAWRPSGGPVEGVVATFVDVSEQVRSRREVEALHRAQRQIAQSLQRSLLPFALPQVSGLHLAARYLPGGAGLEVGGDWYDVFVLPGGDVAFAVGDVEGRGLLAASTMGQLRSALRAYALEDPAPESVIIRLSQLIEVLGGGEFATVAYGVYQPATAALQLACAGHPPPLLISPNRTARYVEEGRCPPLGLVTGPVLTAAMELVAGSTLLLYTDGLIERRGQSLDEGLAALAGAAGPPVTGPDALCDRVIAHLLGRDSAGDDVALLALYATDL